VQYRIAWSGHSVLQSTKNSLIQFTVQCWCREGAINEYSEVEGNVLQWVARRKVQ
jgi:hypothetical protein